MALEQGKYRERLGPGSWGTRHCLPSPLPHGWMSPPDGRGEAPGRLGQEGVCLAAGVPSVKRHQRPVEHKPRTPSNSHLKWWPTFPSLKLMPQTDLGRCAPATLGPCVSQCLRLADGVCFSDACMDTRGGQGPASVRAWSREPAVGRVRPLPISSPTAEACLFPEQVELEETVLGATLQKDPRGPHRGPILHMGMTVVSLKLPCQEEFPGVSPTLEAMPLAGTGEPTGWGVRAAEVGGRRV